MTICLHCIERFVFLTETQCVFCDVGTECVCNWHVTIGLQTASGASLNVATQVGQHPKYQIAKLWHYL